MTSQVTGSRIYYYNSTAQWYNKYGFSVNYDGIHYKVFPILKFGLYSVKFTYEVDFYCMTTNLTSRGYACMIIK